MKPEKKGWRDISIAAICWKPSTEFLTGDWRAYKPVRDAEKCNKCLMCVLFCPDGAVRWKPDVEDVEFDYNFCKGCGVCANECPMKAIDMRLE